MQNGRDKGWGWCFILVFPFTKHRLVTKHRLKLVPVSLPASSPPPRVPIKTEKDMLGAF